MTCKGALQAVAKAEAGAAVGGGLMVGSQSFGVLLLSQRRSLLAYAKMLSGDCSVADDLVQDTFERALRTKARFQVGSRLSAWLRRILTNLFMDRCRKRRRLVDIDSEDVMSLVATPERDDAAEGTTAALLERVTLDDVRSALAEISPKLREVFVLAHLQRRKYQSIATALRVPLSTVGVRLWRARRRLSEVLTARCAPPPGAPAQRRDRRWPAGNIVSAS